MQTQPKIRQQLNELLRCELTVINQYFLHARMLKNWGYDQIGDFVYKQSIGAMKRADTLIERIFFLEGLPNLQDLGKLLIGENPEETLRCDLQAANTQHHLQKKVIAYLEETQDYVSRAIVTKQMHQVEHYIDLLEEQLGQIDDIGMSNYLQSAVSQTQD